MTGQQQNLGKGGPLHVSDCSKLFHPLANQLIKAAQEAGLAYNPDFNGARQEGVGAVPADDERRTGACPRLGHSCDPR